MASPWTRRLTFVLSLAGLALARGLFAGGCDCRPVHRCGSREVVVHCCNCCPPRAEPVAAESARRESGRSRATGIVVESAPVMAYGMMPMMMPMMAAPTVQMAGYRSEAAVRRESSEEERCERLQKDIERLSDQVDKLVSIVDKHGRAIEKIVQTLESHKLLTTPPPAGQ